MKKRSLIEDALFLIFIFLLHIIFYGDFYQLSTLHENPSLEDYVKYIFSNIMPWDIEGNNILTFLRTNLIYEMLILFSIKPILTTSRAYKKMSCFFFGSRISYIRKYLYRCFVRTFAIIAYNVLIVWSFSLLFKLNISSPALLNILSFVFMTYGVIVIISFVNVVSSIYIERYNIIIVNITLIAFLLLSDMALNGISYIYYADFHYTLLSLSFYALALIVLVVKYIMKGNKK